MFHCTANAMSARVVDSTRPRRSRLACRAIGSALIVAAGVLLGPARADAPPSTVAKPPDAMVKELMSRDLFGSKHAEVRMLTVEYLAGGASLPHRHHAQVFVYVLEGAVRMQVEGSAPVTLGPGETFYEGPGDIHTISANASQTAPARILVFIVKDKRTPLSAPVAERRP
jgi:quercetin dioxygenase-like cupin family protein